MTRTIYLEANAKAYKAEQANRKTINDLRHFSSALLERTSEVFKPITTNQDKNQQFLSKSLEQERDQNTKIINSLKAHENKPDIKDPLENKAEDIKEEDYRENKETLSKI